jgi:predicted dehydrogenase
MKKIKLGIIGTGIAAKKLHLPALLRLKDKFEITAVCNHTEPKAKEFSKMIGGVPYFLDYNKMLRESDVEAVDIAVPIDLNYKVTKDVLEAGRHVFLEKPLAANLIEAERMLEFSSRYKSKMMVAENFRYRKIFNDTKIMLDQKKIGSVYAMIWNIFYHVTSDNEYAQTKWRKYHKYAGGFITDGGVHNMAAIRMMFGDIISLNAFSKNINPNIGKPDTISVQFKTAAGVDGILNMFYSANGMGENKLTFFGSDGTIEIDNEKQRLKKSGKKVIEKIYDNDSGYFEEFIDFYNSIVKNKTPLSTFDEAYKDLKTILTALKAAESDKKIKIN